MDMYTSPSHAARHTMVNPKVNTHITHSTKPVGISNTHLSARLAVSNTINSSLI